MRVWLAAGGTAGHINAALALGEEFEKRGHEVCYFTGRRHLDFKLFQNATHLPVYPLRKKGILGPLKGVFGIFATLTVLLAQLWKSRPNIVLGAGGYVCGPTLLAARLVGARVFVLEQNSVVGLTNRLLSRIAHGVFSHFKEAKGLLAKDLMVVGNPVRRSIQLMGTRDVSHRENWQLLVFGGSLGATQLNDVVENLIPELAHKGLRKVIHQRGGVASDAIEEEISGVAYSQLAYIENMAQVLDDSDIIVCRAGASTVSELRYVRRPAVLVPFPGAVDNHQEYNAKQLQQEVDFPVEVVDQSLKGEALAKALVQAIESLRQYRGQPKVYQRDSVEEIVDKVETYG